MSAEQVTKERCVRSTFFELFIILKIRKLQWKRSNGWVYLKEGHSVSISPHFLWRKLESKENLLIIKGYNSYKIPWANVLNLEIQTKAVPKKSQPGATMISQKLLVIDTEEKSFQVDVSDQNPDFKDPSALLLELSKHRKIIGYWACL